MPSEVTVPSGVVAAPEALVLPPPLTAPPPVTTPGPVTAEPASPDPTGCAGSDPVRPGAGAVVPDPSAGGWSGAGWSGRGSVSGGTAPSPMPPSGSTGIGWPSGTGAGSGTGCGPAAYPWEKTSARSPASRSSVGYEPTPSPPCGARSIEPSRRGAVPVTSTTASRPLGVRVTTRLPSVLTRSGSSTPCSCRLVPVGPEPTAAEASSASAACGAGAAPARAAPPMSVAYAIGPPPSPYAVTSGSAVLR